MVSPKTPVLGAVSTLAVALAASPAAAAPVRAPAPTPATTTLATGVLTGADGKPSSGVVQLTAWPVDAGADDLPVVAAATADDRGRFRVSTADMDRLRGLASESQGGRLDFIADGTTLDGHAGTWVFSRFIRPGGAATTRKVSTASAEVGAFAAPRRDAGAPPLRISAGTPADDRSRAAVVRSLALRPGTDAPSAPLVPVDECTNNENSVGKTIAWTPIGELNNAYKDTQAIFRYGKSADTEVSIASSSSGGPFEADGSVTINNEIGTTLTRKVNKYSRTLYSKFEYEELTRASGCTGVKKRIVRGTRWIGGLGSTPLTGTTKVCNPRNPLTTAYRGNDEFKRDEKSARSFSGGVKVFGAGLDVKSGYSGTVSVEYLFGGSSKKAHYLCGERGKSPSQGGRIFSGARP